MLKRLDGLNNCIVNGSATLQEAEQRLQQCPLLLLVDEQGALLRTLNRLELSHWKALGAQQDNLLGELPKGSVAHLTLENDCECCAQRLMSEHGREAVPVLDRQMRPIGLYQKTHLANQIYLSSPHMGVEEENFVAQAFASNWIAPIGPNIDAFEAEMANYAGIKHSVALSSCTAALQLAMALLDIGPGDRVFTSSLTFVASNNAILYQGAEPVLIDSEPNTWNLSPQALQRAFEEAEREGHLPKALMVVHLYGQSADMDPIMALCDHYGVPIIEDAAEAVGATYRGKACGSMGLMGTYSFNGNKIITTSGGGMLLSEDEKLIEKARFLATQARDPAPWYQHSQRGYNYRMSNILAGIGRGQLKVLEERIAARRRNFDIYQEALADIDAINWMPEPDFGRATRWLTAGTLKRHSPEHIIQALADESIEARHVWKPMHQQPLFSDCRFYPHEAKTDVSGRLFETGICLPSGSNLSTDDLERVIDVLKKQLKS